MSNFLRKLWKNKPKQWGSASAVRRAVAENSEKVFGIVYSDMVLAMPFWEGAGNSVRDYSKNAVVATNLGAAWIQSGLRFDGSAKLTFPEISLDEFTLIFKAIQNTPGQAGMVCGRGTGTSHYVWFNSGSYVRLQWAGQAIQFETVSDFSEKHDYLISADGTNTGTGEVIYVDGVFKQLRSVGRLDPFIMGAIGAGYNTLFQFAFDGDIDYFYTTKTALQSEKVSLIKDNPYGLFQKVPEIYYSIPGTGAITGSVVESLSMSDINSRTAQFVSSVVESFGVADIGNNVASFVANLTDNITITDAVINIKNIPGSITDSLVVTDSNTASSILVGILTDSLSIVDNITVSSALKAALLEALNISDATSLGAAITASILEALAVSDIAQANAILAANVVDDISLIDAVIAGLTKQGIILETLSVNDAITFGGFISAIISDSLALTDSGSVKATFNVTINESINVVDAITNIAKLQSAIVEALNLSDVTIETSILPEGLLTISITANSNSITFNISTPKITIGATNG